MSLRSMTLAISACSSAPSWSPRWILSLPTRPPLWHGERQRPNEPLRGNTGLQGQRRLQRDLPFAGFSLPLFVSNVRRAQCWRSCWAAAMHSSSPSRASSKRSRAARIDDRMMCREPDPCVLLTVVISPHRNVDGVKCSLKVKLPMAQARLWDFGLGQEDESDLHRRCRGHSPRPPEPRLCARQTSSCDTTRLRSAARRSVERVGRASPARAFSARTSAEISNMLAILKRTRASSSIGRARRSAESANRFPSSARPAAKRQSTRHATSGPRRVLMGARASALSARSAAPSGSELPRTCAAFKMISIAV